MLFKENQMSSHCLLAFSVSFKNLATILIIVALAPKVFNESIDNVKESNDLNLTNHNIVLDKQVESNVVVDDDTATWIALNDVDETESNNTETTEPNTKD